MSDRELGTSPRVRVLLDECLPRQLRRELREADVHTVRDMGWAGTKNGALLQIAASRGFAAFVTVDRNLEHQQHVAGLALTVIALRARSNDVEDLRPLMPAVRLALGALTPGRVVRIPN